MPDFISSLIWFGTMALIGVVASALIGIGVPSQLASLMAIGLIALPLFLQGDRYRVERWQRKFNRWRRGN